MILPSVPTYILHLELSEYDSHLTGISLTFLSLIHLPSDCQKIADAFITLSNSFPQPTSDFSAVCLRKGM